MKQYTASVVQAASVLFDRCRTLEKLRDLASDAATRGARLAVFPEAFIGGYPRGLTFGAKVGGRTPEGRELFRRYHESAMDVPGPQLDLLGKVAADHHLHLVVGVIERDHGTLYCTVLVFADDGRYLGKHRKLMPTAMERIIWGFGDGSTLSVFPTDVGRIGPVICWENYMPLLRMAMYSKGVQIYCAPTADMRPTWLPTMQHIALEGRCFVLSANQFVRQSDYPKDLQGDLAAPPAVGRSEVSVDRQAVSAVDGERVISTGGSCIVSPLGTVLAGPNHDEEIILTAEIDLDEIVRGKYDFDVVGHYARPDVFQLHVNEAVQAPVVTRGTTPVAD